MRILLDTHTLIWALIDDEHLNEKARSIINNTENQIFYSAASIWEIQIKHDKNPRLIPFDGTDVIRFCDDAGYFALNINSFHTAEISKIIIKEGSNACNDPFDRLLIAQAKYEGMMFLTHDKKAKCFNEPCVIFF